jgi:predicted nucleotidyltransferase
MKNITIFMTTSLRDLLQENREEILKIASKHGAYNLRIFGSVARGQERQDSDVDFLVDMESDRNLLDRIGLMQDLEDLLGRKVDVATVKVLRDFCREGILKDAVPL